jgi:hypothetical protein
MLFLPEADLRWINPHCAVPYHLVKGGMWQIPRWRALDQSMGMMEE